MKENGAFDQEQAKQINKVRMEVLNQLLIGFKDKYQLRSALDVGCGVGKFSHFLSNLNFKTTAIDGRQENVNEAKRRYPQINFLRFNVEENDIINLGKFDLVLCFGLLYHLENPFKAIRNLHNLTGKILIAESMISPDEKPTTSIVDEGRAENQGLNYVALIPSESGLVKMLYHSGFSFIYKVTLIPDHPDFKKSILIEKRRTVLLAASEEIKSEYLEKITPVYVSDIHSTGTSRLLKRFSQIFHYMFVKIKLQFIKIVPIMVFLPWGGIWLCRNNFNGKSILLKEIFNEGEWKVVAHYLQSGMIVLDIGANEGFYTLLASKKVGENGKVISFEPSQRELKRLNLHLKINDCKNVVIEPLALSNEETNTELYVCLGEGTGCNSLRPPNVSDPIKKVKVNVTTLDNYLNLHKLEKIDFIKVDVEGAELNLFKGAKRSLEMFRPIIMCEIADIRTRPWGYKSEEIIKVLEEVGYIFFKILPEGNLVKCEIKTEYAENLFAVPQEKISLVKGYLLGSNEN